jgi:hypothetical protein
MQVFFYFAGDITDDWGMCDAGDMAGQGPWELYGYQTKEKLILQRAMCNLLRLGLFDQHELKTSLEFMTHPSNDNGKPMGKCTVSLTRTRFKKVRTRNLEIFSGTDILQDAISSAARKKDN